MVQKANADPLNLRAGVSKPYDLHYSGTECEIVFGGNQFTTADPGYGTTMVPISVDGIPLVGFILGDGHLLLNLNLFDDCNRLVLRIRNNQLLYRSDAWDITLIGRTLTVREAERQILIEIEFQSPNRVVLRRGRFLCNGVEILVRPEHILVTNNAFLMSGCSAVNCSAGLIIGPHDPPPNAVISLPSISRYLGDRSAAVQWAKDALAGRAV